nr:MAG TPA: hypothetical protein [Caudoviricetes sp.]DAT69709.1 MAG TPA: hypothetical protein [Caudoviricetes sp.]
MKVATVTLNVARLECEKPPCVRCIRQTTPVVIPDNNNCS